MRPLYFIVFGLLLLSTACTQKTITIVKPKDSNARLDFGVTKLNQALRAADFQVQITEQQAYAGRESKNKTIVVGPLKGDLVQNYLKANTITLDSIPAKEGYVIKSVNNTIVIGGADSSGTLYGCLDLKDKITTTGRIPSTLSINDQPEMVIRGTAIGLQKMTILPGRKVYEYPINEKNFPWFYNKKLWIKYLNMMVKNRYNALYLWNGHPFSSLVRLEKYPYAVEVDSATFRKNKEMYAFLTREANKRGIWVIQMFYNILVSKPFAETHHMETQDRKRPIIPVIADYTRRSVAKFVENYPNVGLLVCLGEAIHTLQDDIDWFTKTIIPGVKDGLKALGRTDEPPVILRGHDTQAPAVMEAALPLYHNLYTMEKYTGESLTTYEPRGPWAKVHRKLAAMGSTHMDNVHILSNLEPFRWGSPDFVQKAVQAMHRVHHSNGLHLYPQASYWDWPYTADNVKPRLLEIERDWIWYKTWGRYAWNCHRSRKDEIQYWSAVLGKKFGCKDYGKAILRAYETSGRISPIIIRRFGITEGNRQTMSLGMFMSQLISPDRWGVIALLYNSDGPEGETLTQYAKREWQHKPHQGETPLWAINEILKEAKAAVSAIEKAAPHVTQNTAEFDRLKNDIYCYHAMAHYYAQKVQAALLVLRYQYSNNINDLEKAIPFLEKSVEWFSKLADLTKDSYLYANSMQTGQRTIPISGAEGKNKTWVELLPHYRKELDNFKNNISFLKSGKTKALDVEPLAAATVDILNKDLSTYTVKKGAKPFSDKNYTIRNVATELKGLTGYQTNMSRQQIDGIATNIQFKNDVPVKLVVGFFNSGDRDFVAPSALETNAHANNRGQASVRLLNAVDIPGLPPVNIHTYYYKPGKNRFKLDHGACLILGFIKGDEVIKERNAGFNGGAVKDIGLDWLFY